MKRPFRKKHTEQEQQIDVPKKETYMMYVWCRWQDRPFTRDGSLKELEKDRELLLTEWPKRIKTDNMTFRAEGIDVIKISKNWLAT